MNADTSDVWSRIVEPRLKLGAEFTTQKGNGYKVVKIDTKGFVVEREREGTTERITRSMVEDTARRLADGEELEFQKSKPNGGISHQVGIKAGVVWALGELVARDMSRKVFRASLNTPSSNASVIATMPPETFTATVNRYKRDSALVETLKVKHDYSCQICRYRSSDPHGYGYAEGAHIRPLGGGHDGLDVIGNILILCPTHHVEFDLGIITVTSDTERVLDTNPRSEINGNPIGTQSEHHINADNLRYHNERIFLGKT